MVKRNAHQNDNSPANSKNDSAELFVGPGTETETGTSRGRGTETSTERGIRAACRIPRINIISNPDPRDDPPPGTDYPRVRTSKMSRTRAVTSVADKILSGRGMASDISNTLRFKCTGCVMSCSDKIAKWNALGK